MPKTVKIVGPFTRLASFDADDTPDGLQVMLRPYDPFGDPIKMAGAVRIELYEFVPASGDPKGRRIEQWDIPLATEHDQQTYWNRTTQMYEFRLTLNAPAAPPERKYVLGATCTTPLNERLTDEYILELPPGEAALAGKATARRGGAHAAAKLPAGESTTSKEKP